MIKASIPKDKLRAEMDGVISRLHIIVVGPGLGREDFMQNAARTAIELAKSKNQYIVIDADGLFLICNDPSVIQGYKRAVLTPNVVEFGRLCETMVGRKLVVDTNMLILPRRKSTRKVTPTHLPKSWRLRSAT